MKIKFNRLIFFSLVFFSINTLAHAGVFYEAATPTITATTLTDFGYGLQ
jgi:hypothetical protein